MRKWGQWIKKQAEKELAEFYPTDPDGSTPIAYLWGRTIICEGPGCGCEVPLIRSLWLAKKSNKSVALQLVPNPRARCVEFKIITKDTGRWLDQDNPKVEIESPTFDGTVKRGSATCPCCGYTTPVASVREQLRARRGGANDARLFCVVTSRPDKQGRFYRLPCKADVVAVQEAGIELGRRTRANQGPLSLVPNEPISPNEIRRITVPIYGMATWGDLFSQRQLLALSTFTSLVRILPVHQFVDRGLFNAVATCLAFSVSRLADFNSSISRWANHREGSAGTFGRQALPMLWDFAETCPLSDSTGAFSTSVALVAGVLDAQDLPSGTLYQNSAQMASATAHPLPDHAAHALITDPPYYDAIPYSHLSDFFYVWLRRSIGPIYPDMFSNDDAPKDQEIVVDRPHELSNSTHDVVYYERQLTKAFGEARRILRPEGIGAVVFASKTTASWEAILKAVVDADWTITGSWPIDTELETRIAAQGQGRLASSVHLVCRPRNGSGESANADATGDWRDVLAELPKRIRDWMPRLRHEGIVGADAIFACLGPALEIFSRYTHVEKASGEQVTLKEYLEYVWAAVAKEALNMIFEGADATGFEEDARLTAMWLWTLSTGSEVRSRESEVSTEDEEEEKDSGKKGKLSGFVLEYDAARKIAQGLGAHLERLTSLVEIAGETARLLPVSERARHLFGKDEGAAPTKRKAKPKQLSFTDVLDEAEEEGGWGEKNAPKVGSTVLDRVHQSMILFAAGRNEALKRFLVTDGAGQDRRFWHLADALCKLYPPGTHERRWVEGVMARKKGLGF